MAQYFRPLVQSGPLRPSNAKPLAGGAFWFTHAACHKRGQAPVVVPSSDIPEETLNRLTAPRPDLCGLTLNKPRLMGILNVTPDSFSDGGQFLTPDAALTQARVMADRGADILDIGGESTRPGASVVPIEEEISRTAPIIQSIRAGFDGVISIDTRKAKVAQAALKAGADLVNDVSALTFDADLAKVVQHHNAPVCLMHAQGSPEVMQNAPRYDDVLLDVYDALSDRIEQAVDAGIARSKIIVDPGIGFGKTVDHNLTLLAHISLFHGLACPILVGASRKRFIGTLGAASAPRDRMPGSVGVALAAVAQGVQILRVHDIADTKQALTLWWAATKGTQ